MVEGVQCQQTSPTGVCEKSKPSELRKKGRRVWLILVFEATLVSLYR